MPVVFKETQSSHEPKLNENMQCKRHIRVNRLGLIYNLYGLTKESTTLQIS